MFSLYYDVNGLDHFPRSLDTSTRFAEIFDQAYFPNHKNPALLYRFEYFQLARDHAEFYNHEQKDMKRAFSGEGAWNQGNDVDPKIANDDEFSYSWITL